jgi:hypothetical protein
LCSVEDVLLLIGQHPFVCYVSFEYDQVFVFLRRDAGHVEHAMEDLQVMECLPVRNHEDLVSVKGRSLSEPRFHSLDLFAEQ